MMLLHRELTDTIIGAFYTVYNGLGPGFLEKVYENALKMELERLELDVKAQMPISVYYLSKPVGEFFCDLCVEDSVIIEVKAAESLSSAHEAQIFNYLKATPIEVGLLLNFGPRPEFVRKLLTNDMKPWIKDLPAERSDDLS